MENSVSQGARTGGSRAPTRLVLDVKRAFLHGAIQRLVYIRLPAEDPKRRVPGLLGKLRKIMLSLGFVCSSSTPSVFRHERRDIVVVTHVDDF